MIGYGSITLSCLNDMDSVTIGGRNLLLETAKEQLFTCSTGSGYSNYFRFSAYGLNLVSQNTSDEFTVGFHFVITGAASYGGINPSVIVELNGTQISAIEEPSDYSPTGSSEVGYFSKCFKLTSAQANYSDTFGVRVGLINCAQGASLKLTRLKIEKGNKPTDWTSAPEDLEGKVDSIEWKVASGVHNLLRNTGSLEDWIAYVGGSFITKEEGWPSKILHYSPATSSTYRGMIARPFIPYSAVRNKRVTFSAKVKADEGVSVHYVFFVTVQNSSMPSTYGKYGSIAIIHEGTGEWETVFKSLTITDSMFTSGSGTYDFNTCYFTMMPAIASDTYNVEGYVREMKLEYGDYVTAWEPSSEDAEAMAIRRSLSCYIRVAAGSAKPNKPTSVSTSTTPGDNTWAYAMPEPKKNYVYYTCQENTYADGRIEYTDVQSYPEMTYMSKWCAANDVTKIDGGTIMTGTVTSDKIYVTDLKAICANIAEWTLSGRRIESDMTGNGGYRIGMQNSGSTASNPGAVFYAGCNTAAGGSIGGEAYSNFYVTQAGYMYCKSAKIAGNITATSGTIGGFTINNGYLEYGSWGTSGGFLIKPGGTTGTKSIGGSDSIAGWALAINNTFGITTGGKMYATAGRIAGWEMTTNAIYKFCNYTVGTTTSDCYLKKLWSTNSGSTGWAFSVQKCVYNPSASPQFNNYSNIFYIQNNGHIRASSFSFGCMESVNNNVGADSDVWVKHAMFVSYGMELLAANDAGSPYIDFHRNMTTPMAPSNSKVYDFTARIINNHDDRITFYGRNTTSGTPNTCTLVAGSWSVSSDRRLKKSIKQLNIDSAKRFIKSLKPSRFEYKNEPGITHHGFIYDEVDRVKPDRSWVVSELQKNMLDNGDSYGSVNVVEIVADLVKVVQQQMVEIEDLKARLH